MADRICPECAEDLTGKDARAHALSHWPEYLEELPGNKQARDRQAVLYDWAEDDRDAYRRASQPAEPPREEAP